MLDEIREDRGLAVPFRGSFVLPPIWTFFDDDIPELYEKSHRPGQLCVNRED